MLAVVGWSFQDNYDPIVYPPVYPLISGESKGVIFGESSDDIA